MLYIIFSLRDNWYIQTEKHNSRESGLKFFLLLRQNANIQKSKKGNTVVR